MAKLGTVLLIMMILVPGEALVAKAENPEHLWAPFRPLVGKWAGQRESFGIKADQTTEWKWVLGKKYLQCRSTSIAESDPHQDLGILSYDRSRKRFIYRGFYSEGFVNQYLVTIEDDGSKLVFDTESIENGPPGLKARLVWRIEGDQLRVQLFLASGNEPFRLCVDSKLRRQSDE